MENITFTEEQIQLLFGYEAAENESPDRLKQYFFKTDTYNKIHGNLPLRILVGHKGIGKSAILRMSYLDNLDKNNLSLWVRPDDVDEICNCSGDDINFNKLTRSWKNGLESLITKMIIEKFDAEDKFTMVEKGLSLFEKIASIVKFVSDNVDVPSAKKLIAKQYQKNNKIYIYIDDLDRGWSGEKKNVTRISALLSAVRDMSTDIEGLSFKISLRSDVYYLVRTSDESTDKVDGSVIWLSWTNHEILVLLAKRIQSYLGKKISEKDLLKLPQYKIAEYLYEVMDDRFQGDGKWRDAPIHQVILSLIRRRPRDIVKLCCLAARNANARNVDKGKPLKIKSEDWEDVFARYSRDRLQDTINEHRYELPDIERLLLGMKPGHKGKKTSEGYLYSEEGLFLKLKGILQGGKFYFSNGREASNQDLLGFMFKINFILGRKKDRDGYIDRKYFEDNQYISTGYANFGYEWEVHPAFRWALYPESRDIFSEIDLPAEI